MLKQNREMSHFNQNFNDNDNSSSSAAAASSANVNDLVGAMTSLRVKPLTLKQKRLLAAAKGRQTKAAKAAARAQHIAENVAENVATASSNNDLNALLSGFNSLAITKRRHKKPYSFNLMTNNNGRRSSARLSKLKKNSLNKRAAIQAALNQEEEIPLSMLNPKAAASIMKQRAAQAVMDMNEPANMTSSAVAASSNMNMNVMKRAKKPTIYNTMRADRVAALKKLGVTPAKFAKTLKAIQNAKDKKHRNKMANLNRRVAHSTQQHQRTNRASKRNFPQPFVFDNNVMREGHMRLMAAPNYPSKHYGKVSRRHPKK